MVTCAVIAVSVIAVASVALALSGGRSMTDRSLIGFAALCAPVLAAFGAGWLCLHFALFPVWFLAHIAAMLVCWCLMVFGVFNLQQCEMLLERRHHAREP